jgi:hypothetical protein
MNMIGDEIVELLDDISKWRRRRKNRKEGIKCFFFYLDNSVLVEHLMPNEYWEVTNSKGHFTTIDPSYKVSISHEVVNGQFDTHGTGGF